MKRPISWLAGRVNLFEKRCIIRTLRKYKGNVMKTVAVLGRNREEFYRLMKKHNINPNNYREKTWGPRTMMAPSSALH